MYKNEYEKRLYKSYKNNDPITWLVPVSIVLLLMGVVGIACNIMLWFSFYCWCKYNDRKLDNDEKIRKQRESYNKIRNEE